MLGRKSQKSSDFWKAKKVAGVVAKIAMIPVEMISGVVPGGRSVTRVANVVTKGLVTGLTLIVMVTWYKLAGQRS